MNRDVVLVEDHRDARELLGDALQRRGWRVRAFATAEEALTALEREPPVAGALVTDIVLPGIDGIELVERVANAWPALLRVVITSFGDKEHVKRALNAGAHHLIEKPFTGTQLDETLTRLQVRREEAEEDRMVSLFQRRLHALPLTAEERQLVTWVLKGLPNRSIALIAECSEQQVKNQLHRIYQKAGVASRSELFHLLFPI